MRIHIEDFLTCIVSPCIVRNYWCWKSALKWTRMEEEWLVMISEHRLVCLMLLPLYIKWHLTLQSTEWKIQTNHRGRKNETQTHVLSFIINLPRGLIMLQQSFLASPLGPLTFLFWSQSGSLNIHHISIIKTKAKKQSHWQLSIRTHIASLQPV